MTKSKISRRKFVGRTVLGAGCLAASSTLKLTASENESLIPLVQSVWKSAKEYTMDFARAMPDEKYGFKPTPEVYSYAEQILHLVGGNFWFFATIKGEKPPESEDALKSEGKTKDDVIKLFEESFEVGDEVVNGLTEKDAQKEVTWGKAKLPAWKIILFCADHITHHRGQMVVYLRLNGIKPPQYRSGYYG